MDHAHKPSGVTHTPALVMAGIFLAGMAAGWLGHASLPGREKALEAEVPAARAPSPRPGVNTLGVPAGDKPGGTGNLPSGDIPASTMPMGLSADRILQDLLQGLASGTLKEHGGIRGRLELLLEAGEAGRRSLLDFLKLEVHYSTNGEEITESGYNSLRHMVLGCLSEKKTPEAVVAMKYILKNAPDLYETLHALQTLENWEEAEIDLDTGKTMRSLAASTIRELPKAGSGKDLALQRAAIVARKLKDEALMREVEAIYIANLEDDSHTAATDYGKIFVSASGDEQQATLDRIGITSDLARSIRKQADFLEMLDYGQPAVRELMSSYFLDNVLKPEEMHEVLTGRYLMTMPEVRLNGTGGGMSWGSRTHVFRSAAEKQKYSARLDGIEGFLKEVSAASQVPESVQELAREKIEEVKKRRLEAEQWEVEQ